MPKVSVIIPTYNREQLIARAIESVLAQTFRDFEIIVIDDGSIDKTQNILASFNGRIKNLTQENRGISAARNRGILEAVGQYVAFLDSDDYWTPEKLTEQVRILDAHDHVGIVYCRMPIINQKGQQVGLKPSGISGRNFREILEVWGDLPTSSVLIRRECFDKAGLFDIELNIAEDTEMWLRISRFYDLYEIKDKVLAYYYRHDDQITHNKITVYQGAIKTDKKIMAYYKDAPMALIISRIAMNEYLTAKIYYNQGDYRKALNYVWEALSYRFFLGILFFEPKDGWMEKLLRFIKPYGLLLVCSLRILVQGKGTGGHLRP